MHRAQYERTEARRRDRLAAVQAQWRSLVESGATDLIVLQLHPSSSLTAAAASSSSSLSPGATTRGAQGRRPSATSTVTSRDRGGTSILTGTAAGADSALAKERRALEKLRKRQQEEMTRILEQEIQMQAIRDRMAAQAQRTTERIAALEADRDARRAKAAEETARREQLRREEEEREDRERAEAAAREAAKADSIAKKAVEEERARRRAAIQAHRDKIAKQEEHRLRTEALMAEQRRALEAKAREVQEREAERARKLQEQRTREREEAARRRDEAARRIETALQTAERVAREQALSQAAKEREAEERQRRWHEEREREAERARAEAEERARKTKDAIEALRAQELDYRARIQAQVEAKMSHVEEFLRSKTVDHVVRQGADGDKDSHRLQTLAEARRRDEERARRNLEALEERERAARAARERLEREQREAQAASHARDAERHEALQRHERALAYRRLRTLIRTQEGEEKARAVEAERAAIRAQKLAVLEKARQEKLALAEKFEAVRSSGSADKLDRFVRSMGVDPDAVRQRAAQQHNVAIAVVHDEAVGSAGADAAPARSVARKVDAAPKVAAVAPAPERGRSVGRARASAGVRSTGALPSAHRGAETRPGTGATSTTAADHPPTSSSSSSANSRSGSNSHGFLPKLRPGSANKSGPARPTSSRGTGSDPPRASGQQQQPQSKPSATAARSEDSGASLPSIHSIIDRETIARELADLRRRQNERLLTVLEEEQVQEDHREATLAALTDGDERRRVEEQFALERGAASERILRISQENEEALAEVVKSLEAFGASGGEPMVAASAHGGPVAVAATA